MSKQYHPWEEWFAWRPVKLKDGTRTWLRKIYRRAEMKTYATYDDWTRYQYGTLFDVLAQDHNHPYRYVDFSTNEIVVFDGTKWYRKSSHD